MNRSIPTILLTGMLVNGLALASGCQEEQSTEKTVVLGTPKKLHDGFQFVEGPTPDAEGNVYFSDIPDEKIHVHTVEGELETFMTGSKRCNGLGFDEKGRLWACQGGEGRVIRIDMDTKEITPIAATMDGGPFLSPNDLALDAHGGAYFTDPAYWRHPDSKVDEAVYYVDKDGNITRLVEKLLRPNGLLLSPDGKTMYLLPMGEKRLIAYEVLSPGKIGPGRDLVKLPAGGDGLTCDTEGNLYLTQPRLRSIVVYSPEGKELDSVKLRRSPSNICFGGPGFDQLYVTAGDSFYHIPVNRSGLGPGSVGQGRFDTSAAE